MLHMMKVCGVLEMDTIEKGQPIALNYEHKNRIFFPKKGTVKIVNSTNDTVKYVVKRGNIFGELVLYNKEITNLTNTSRQTVSNVLSKMRQKGIINYAIESISVNKNQ